MNAHRLRWKLEEARLRFTYLILGLALASSALAALVGPTQAAPVLMISIDGLRPGDVLDAKARGVKVPVLEAMAREGAYATGVRNVLPTVTYPDHTTLVTGVWPAVHGIAANVTFDPLRKNLDGWYWYSPSIKVPTLWDAAHASGRVVASVGWPVSVDNPAIDFDIPEYWRAYTPEDIKLVHALATRGLPEEVEAKSQVTLADILALTPAADEAKARMAAAIIALKHPAFFTLHLSSLDEEEHLHGPGSPEAYDALARIDAAVGGLVAAARREEPGLVVLVVSDHGFAPVEHDINIATAFVKAGLITLDAAGKPVAWDAAPWISGGSAAVVLAHPDDAALRAKVAALLDELKADPDSGIAEVIDRPAIAAMGGAPDSDVFMDAKIGYEFGSGLTGPLIAPGRQKGTHGYFPTHPEMRSTFIITGPGVPVHGSLGEIDMRDIAPTVAKILEVSLPSATGHPIF
jgi:predicted AlkP superfamily pyrophosphatase or phosphodiesterase